MNTLLFRKYIQSNDSTDESGLMLFTKNNHMTLISAAVGFRVAAALQPAVGASGDLVVDDGDTGRDGIALGHTLVYDVGV